MYLSGWIKQNVHFCYDLKNNFFPNSLRNRVIDNNLTDIDLLPVKASVWWLSNYIGSGCVRRYAEEILCIKNSIMVDHVDLWEFTLWMYILPDESFELNVNLLPIKAERSIHSLSSNDGNVWQFVMYFLWCATGTC